MELTNISTLHAPAERIGIEELKHEIKLIEDSFYTTQAFNSAGIPIIIINKYRQAVFANKAFMSLIGTDSPNNILGKRPGEIVNCINANSLQGGCGTSEACRYCNAVNTILKSINDTSNNSGEVILRTTKEGNEVTMNLLETVDVIKLSGEEFFVVSLTDISDSKRKVLLERVFFHDILNTAGGLKGLVSFLKNDVPSELKEEVEFIEDNFLGLVNDIIAQRHLLEAENNNLEADFITLDAVEVINSVSKLYRNHDISQSKEIRLAANLQECKFKSDIVLLKRVLSNMLKNALEATSKGGAVTIGCKIISDGTDYIEFYVQNDKFISRDIQMQIFQRSFSTKGKGRGLGTYSMKLLGEKYLNGKVSFASSEDNGTTFYLRLKI